ncbi:MAG: trypsin-like peptidase domain-containing protein [Clostridia bacterium]|nr:trypsin-like peptidase domain-containing protein [Clostridia bacterium]
MDNFENNKEVELQQTDEAVEEIPVNETKTEEIPTQEVVSDASSEDFSAVYNPVTVGEIVPEKDDKLSGRGLKIFAFIMAMVILISTACVTGYFVGKNNGAYKSKVNVNLASKPANTDEMTAAQVYDKVSDSVVGIIVYNENGSASYASGVIYTEDGYIVTNDHIYSNVPAPKFKVYTQDGKEYSAEYVAGDTVSDLAVLKMDGKSFKAASFGNSDELIYGESVVAIGCPNEPTDKASITRGIVSAVDRRVQTTSSYSARLIQTDSPINPGSSGGALVNMYGQVVGITSAKLVAEAHESVGYAIPTTTMKYIVEELIKEGKVVSRARLGITYFAVDSIAVELGKYKYVGLLVDSVAEDSDLYGKLKKGDTIVQINGVDTTDDAVVLNIIEQSRAGDKITVTIVTESGESKTYKATLRANVGESSYQADINRLPQTPESNKDFNFPEGEE